MREHAGISAKKIFANLRRISFYVLHSRKSASRKGLPLPYMPENAEDASTRALGAKKRVFAFCLLEREPFPRLSAP